MHLHPRNDFVDVSPYPQRLRLPREIAAEDASALRAEVAGAEVHSGEEEGGVYCHMSESEERKGCLAGVGGRESTVGKI